MRRKRRNRGSWFPTVGHTETQGENVFPYSDIRVPFTQVPNTGSTGGAQIAFTVVPDFTAEESAVAGNVAASLKDRVSGNAWLLQRIVGKLHLQCAPVPDDDGSNASFSAIFLKLGFFVARSEDFDQAQPDLFVDEFSPMHVDNAMDPWIFQRSWMLANPLHTAVNGRIARWPSTTADYGSLNAGGHIDTKSKRLISREHRLFCVIEGRGYSPDGLEVSGGDEVQPGFSGILDLRVYGSLRNSKPGSSF